MKEARQQILARHRQNCEAESRLFSAAMMILPVSFAPSDFDDEIDRMQKKMAELGRKLKKHNDAMEDQLASALPKRIVELEAELRTTRDHRDDARGKYEAILCDELGLTVEYWDENGKEVIDR